MQSDLCQLQRVPFNSLFSSMVSLWVQSWFVCTHPSEQGLLWVCSYTSSVGPQPRPEVWHQWNRSSSSAEGLQPQLKQGLTPHGLLQPETDKGRGTPGSWPGGDFLKPQETEGRSGELQLNCSPVLMNTTNTAPTAQAGTGRVQGNGKTFSRQAPQPGIRSNGELHV